MQAVFKNIIPVFILLSFFACKSKQEENAYHLPDWSSRLAAIPQADSLKTKRAYLPVYPQIYEISEKRKIDLAATVSIRNTDISNTIYLGKIDYYNTEGKLIRKYIDKPVYIKPLETIEIIIKSTDNEGGTGANFIFEWLGNEKASKPLFEAVMLTTSGQQGISFTCRAVEIN
jgi:hypothetical protein